MNRRYLWTIVVVISVFCMLVASSRDSNANSEKSTCEEHKGQLLIKQVLQIRENWCWVATVSEVLQWYGLPKAEKCEIYDLAKGTTALGTTACQDIADFPDDWWIRNNDTHNQLGNAEAAAKAYATKNPGSIEVETRGTPLQTFEEVVNHICPKDTLGRPFIFIYENITKHHDVVVYGYNEAGALYVHNPLTPECNNDEGIEIPGCPLDATLQPEDEVEPNTILFNQYQDTGQYFIQDVVISKK